MLLYNIYCLNLLLKKKLLEFEYVAHIQIRIYLINSMCWNRKFDNKKHNRPSNDITNFDSLLCVMGIAECCGETTIILRRVGRIIHHEHLCGGVGVNSGIWVWRMGKHAQFHTPSRHIWSIHKVLPMPTSQSLRREIPPTFQKVFLNNFKDTYVSV